MRRVLLLSLVSAGALFVVALTRGAGPTKVPDAPQPAPPRETPLPPAPAVPEPARPLRNLFEYGEAPPAEPAVRPRPLILEPEAAPTSAPVPVRLVGILHRGGTVKAAIVVEGNLVLLSPGDSSAGYSLLSADEDDGAVVRTPSGAEIRLSPPP